LRGLVTKFHHWQAKIIEEYKTPEQFITHNFDFEWHNYSFGLQPDTNQYDCASCMTVAGGDIYHPSQDHLTGAEITACGNLLRGLKQDNYLILETQAQGNIEWLPYPRQLRLCAYSHLANGANSVMYWHWHSIHNAIESYWKGVLSHDFSENRTYQEAAVIGNELKRISPKIKNLQKKNDVGILLDHESLTGLKQFPTGSLSDASYNTIFRWLSDALYRANIEYDAIYTQNMHLDDYKLVLVPSLYSASEETLRKLKEYVSRGGHLVVTLRSGFSDEHIKIYSDVQPHILHECLGISYDQFTIPENVSLDCHFELNNQIKPEVREWMELVTPVTAASLAKYVHPAWDGYSAITENYYNNGKSYYVGCYFDDNTMDAFLSYVIDELEFKKEPLRFPLIVKKGINDDGNEIRYYFNYSKELQRFTYNGPAAISLLNEIPVQTGDSLMLEPWGVIIIEITR
jgi:beta-galactosidase